MDESRTSTTPFGRTCFGAHSQSGALIVYNPDGELSYESGDQKISFMIDHKLMSEAELLVVKVFVPTELYWSPSARKLTTIERQRVRQEILDAGPALQVVTLLIDENLSPLSELGPDSPRH